MTRRARVRFALGSLLRPPAIDARLPVVMQVLDQCAFEGSDPAPGLRAALGRLDIHELVADDQMDNAVVALVAAYNRRDK